MEMGEIYKRIRKMEDVLSDAREEASKFDRGNSLAGKRIRKNLLQIKNEAHSIRKRISEIKNK